MNHSAWGLTSTFLPALTPFLLQGPRGLVYSSSALIDECQESRRLRDSPQSVEILAQVLAQVLTQVSLISSLLICHLPWWGSPCCPQST